MKCPRRGLFRKRMDQGGTTDEEPPEFEYMTGRGLTETLVESCEYWSVLKKKKKD